MRKGIKQYLKDLKIGDNPIKSDNSLENLKVLYRYSRKDYCVVGTIVGASVQHSSLYILFDNDTDCVCHINSVEVLINEC